MSGDTLDFLQGNRETLTGTLHDPAGTTGHVLTVQADKSIKAAAGGGGGSSPISTVTLAYNTPGLAVQAFAVTAVVQLAQTFTIAGDHHLLFPATAALVVSGSTGNDATYSVASVAVVGGNTVVTTNEAIPDATADGSLNNSGTAGIVVSTGSGYVMDLMDTTVLFDGNPQISLYQRDITRSGFPINFHDEIGSVGISRGNSAPFAVMTQLTAPLIAVLDLGGDGIAPGCTQGATTMQLWTFA